MKKLTLDEYKAVVLNVLFKIDDICRENGLVYYLQAGTLLGAVRHKGYIPWDDDIDIAMFRPDYDRLAQIIQTGNYGLNFLRIEECPDTIYAFGKICDTSTTLTEKNFRTPKGYGAFVDVFPLDYAPDDFQEQERLRVKFERELKLITHSARTSYERSGNPLKDMERCLAFWAAKPFNTQKLIRKLNMEFMEAVPAPTDYAGVLWERSYPVEDLGEPSLVEFEGRMLMAPANPAAVLTALFGDYMELPPVEERVCKHQLECYVDDELPVSSGRC